MDDGFCIKNAVESLKLAATLHAESLSREVNHISILVECYVMHIHLCQVNVTVVYSERECNHVRVSMNCNIRMYASSYVGCYI